MRRITILLGSITALVLGILLAWPRIDFFLMTGSLFPVRKIETLRNPVAVTGWSADGLRLSDGRSLPLPGLRSLPGASDALAEATKRGVEIDADGRIRALVRVHHWCGNDPVREHIARVDLSEWMTFLRLGEPVGPAPGTEYPLKEPGGRFTDYGWDIGEFLMFQSWQVERPVRPLPR